jgi:hypothetical protein
MATITQTGASVATTSIAALALAYDVKDQPLTIDASCDRSMIFVGEEALQENDPHIAPGNARPSPASRAPPPNFRAASPWIGRQSAFKYCRPNDNQTSSEWPGDLLERWNCGSSDAPTWVRSATSSSLRSNVQKAHILKEINGQLANGSTVRFKSLLIKQASTPFHLNRAM